MIWPFSRLRGRRDPDARATTAAEKAAKCRTERDRKWLDRFFRRHPDHGLKTLDPGTQKAMHLAQRMSIELEMEGRVRQYREQERRQPFDAAKKADEQKRRGPGTEPCPR